MTKLLKFQQLGQTHSLARSLQRSCDGTAKAIMYGTHFEKEVYLTAIATMDSHGEAACGEAVKRAGELHCAGDELGNWQWHQVTEAILEIERHWRHEGEYIH